MDNLVSVVISTYNLADTLTEYCIPSILQQTHQNFEIIIIGDGCTDNTGELIKSKFNDTRIYYENLPEHKFIRHGVVGIEASNLALGLQRGEWNARLNDDDMFEPDHIEALLNFALANNYNFAYGIQEGIGTGGFGCGDLCHGSAIYDNRVFGHIRYKYQDHIGDVALRARMWETGLVRYGFLRKIVTSPAPRSEAWYKRNIECYGIKEGFR